MGRGGSLVAGALGLAGCTPCDERPPVGVDDLSALTIVGGAFLDRATVELAFSRPLAPVDGVDPTKFRLSMGWARNDHHAGHCSSTTSYCDLASRLGDDYAEGCGRCSYGYGYGGDDVDPCAERIAVASLSLADDDAARLHLRLSAPIDPLVCAQLDYLGDDAMVLPHFAAFGLPTITDLDGAALADIAPRWAVAGEIAARHDGLFPFRDALVPIPCPEDGE